MAGRQRAAQGDGDRLQVGKTLLELGADVDVGIGSNVALGNIDLRGADTKDLVGIFLVPDRDVGVGDELLMTSMGFLPHFQSLLR